MHTNHPKYLKRQFIKLHYVQVGKALLKYKYVPLEVLIEKLKTEMKYSNVLVPRFTTLANSEIYSRKVGTCPEINKTLKGVFFEAFRSKSG